MFLVRKVPLHLVNLQHYSRGFEVPKLQYFIQYLFLVANLIIATPKYDFQVQLAHVRINFDQ